jgi:hypothetical protein
MAEIRLVCDQRRRHTRAGGAPEVRDGPIHLPPAFREHQRRILQDQMVKTHGIEPPHEPFQGGPIPFIANDLHVICRGSSPSDRNNVSPRRRQGAGKAHCMPPNTADMRRERSC